MPTFVLDNIRLPILAIVFFKNNKFLFKHSLMMFREINDFTNCY